MPTPMPTIMRSLMVAIAVSGMLLIKCTSAFSYYGVKGGSSQVYYSVARTASTRLYAEAKKKKRAVKKKKKASAAVSAMEVVESPAVVKKKAAKKISSKKASSKQMETVTATSAATSIGNAAMNAAITTTEKKKPWTGPVPKDPELIDFDITGGRPGMIIESVEHLERKAKIFEEIDSGKRKYPAWLKEEYGFLLQDQNIEYENGDDPEAIDSSTLGQYDIFDLMAKFDREWDPETERDPNEIVDKENYVQELEKDEEGVEVKYDPIFGSWDPIDYRAKVGWTDSYMVDEETRDDDKLTPMFEKGDIEEKYNEDFVKFRKSLHIIDTYTDEFLPESIQIPRISAKWYGYPEQTSYPKKPYTNNRFTKPEDLTNFDEMTPYRARQRAVELARAQNPEWLPKGVSHAWHREQRRIYDEVGTLVGSLEEGECDPDIVERIQPALKILGSCVKLLSIEQGTVFRFHYFGLMKNKFGMSCWTETLIRDCDVEVTGVVFETGFRRRDPLYDGGDRFVGPHW